jgi:hypothetical protein
MIDSFEIHKFLYDEPTRIVLPCISLVTNANDLTPQEVYLST